MINMLVQKSLWSVIAKNKPTGLISHCFIWKL